MDKPIPPRPRICTPKIDIDPVSTYGRNGGAGGCFGATAVAMVCALVLWHVWYSEHRLYQVEYSMNGTIEGVSHLSPAFGPRHTVLEMQGGEVIVFEGLHDVVLGKPSVIRYSRNRKVMRQELVEAVNVK